MSETVWATRQQSLEELFDLIDVDFSESISVKELGHLLALIDPEITREKVNSTFNAIDVDGSKVIEKKEFVAHFLDLFKDKSKAAFDSRFLLTKRYLTRKPKLTSLFHKYDTDGSGTLDKIEFKALILSVKGEAAAEEKTDAIFKKLDVDGSDGIEEDEFVGYFFNLFRDVSDREFRARYEATLHGRRAVRLRQVYVAFDVDGNGSLDVNEFARMLRACGKKFMDPASILDTLIKLDKNKDRSVDFEEWMGWMSTHIATWSDEMFNRAVSNMLRAAASVAAKVVS